MSEIPLPNQEQLHSLLQYGEEVLREHGMATHHETESAAPVGFIHDQPLWAVKDAPVFEFSIASPVLQRLAPEQCKILGLDAYTCTQMVTDFSYEALRYWKEPPEEPLKDDELAFDGARLVIASGLQEGDYETMHSVQYQPTANRYVADILVLEGALLPADFEQEFTVRVHAAALHVVSLLPRIARLEF